MAVPSPRVRGRRSQWPGRRTSRPSPRCSMVEMQTHLHLLVVAVGVRVGLVAGAGLGFTALEGRVADLRAGGDCLVRTDRIPCHLAAGGVGVADRLAARFGVAGRRAVRQAAVPASASPHWGSGHASSGPLHSSVDSAIECRRGPIRSRSRSCRWHRPRRSSPRRRTWGEVREAAVARTGVAAVPVAPQGQAVSARAMRTHSMSLA